MIYTHSNCSIKAFWKFTKKKEEKIDNLNIEMADKIAVRK